MVQKSESLAALSGMAACQNLRRKCNPNLRGKMKHNIIQLHNSVNVGLTVFYRSFQDIPHSQFEWRYEGG